MAHSGDSGSESDHSGVDSSIEEYEHYELTPEETEEMFAMMQAAIDEDRRERAERELAAWLEEQRHLTEEARSLMEILGLTEDMFQWLEVEGWQEGDELVFIPSDDEEDLEEDGSSSDEGSSGESSSGDDSDFFD